MQDLAVQPVARNSSHVGRSSVNPTLLLVLLLVKPAIPPASFFVNLAVRLKNFTISSHLILVLGSGEVLI